MQEVDSVAKKSPLERAARALCSLKGLPENIKFEGRPMWESFLPEARAALTAIQEPSDEMTSAGSEVMQPGTLWGSDDVWRAMATRMLADG